MDVNEIDRDPLELGEYRADHLLRDLRDCDLAHLDAMKNRRVPVNLRDDVLNLDQMVAMKDDRLMDGPQMDDQNSDAMMDDLMNLKNPVLLNPDAMMDGPQKDDQNLDVMMDDRLMDDQNYLVVLNYCDVLPCSYSLISIKLISYDHTRILQELFLTKDVGKIKKGRS